MDINIQIVYIYISMCYTFSSEESERKWKRKIETLVKREGPTLTTTVKKGYTGLVREE